MWVLLHYILLMKHTLHIQDSIYVLYTLALPKTFKLSGHRIIRSSPFTTKLLAKIGRDDLEKCKAGV